MAVTILAAWRRLDPVESFGWAAAAPLATLPVTWYHYPSALTPIALAALLRAPVERRDRVRVLVLAAGVTAAVALLALPLLWVAVALVIAATVTSKVRRRPYGRGVRLHDPRAVGCRPACLARANRAHHVVAYPVVGFTHESTCTGASSRRLPCLGCLHRDSVVRGYWVP